MNQASSPKNIITDGLYFRPAPITTTNIVRAKCFLKRYLLIVLLFATTINAFSQVDREFWFAIPKETSGHGSITAVNNVSFKIAAMSLPAVVTISMPANAAFPVQTYNVPANSSTIAVMATSFATFANVYNNNAASAGEAVTGKTNRGILIQADNDITVYYDYDDDYNRDLFSLKGKNSLGTDFYCPFQQIWPNGAYNPRPLSSIEIVATENNTIVTVYPTVKFKGRPNSNPFSITLNRGEAYSVVDSSQTAAGHAAGTRVTSDKNIAVTINDDSGKGANSTCYDIMGDQLVPVNILGTKYLIMTGNASLTHPTAGITPHDAARGDAIVVTATQPNTIIKFWGSDHLPPTLLYTTTLNAGQTDYFSPDITKANQTSIYVSCTDPSKPFIVQHITGIGCELGGAIVPPITNCTGSNDVTFYPSLIAGNQTEVTVNLMIKYDKNYSFTDSVHQSHYYFTLYNSTYPAGYHIPGGWFELNDSAGWAVLKVANRNFGQSGISTGKNLVVWGANKIVNTMDFFHLGMTDGRQYYTNKYGYFSSFNVRQAEVRVASTSTQDYVGCYGKTITLAAAGGLDYTWHYGSPTGPPTYINDPKSPNPDVIGAPPGSHNFYVEVKQSKCFGTTVLKVNVVILPQTTARLALDKTTICAIDTVRFLNQSIQASIFSWKKKVDNYPEIDFYPPNDMSFYEVLDNKSNTTASIVRYTLYAEHAQGCNDTISRVVNIYPKINAAFTTSDTIVCHDDPRQPIKFTDKSGGNLGIYTWDFGDQGSAIIPSPQHQFSNTGMTDTTYKVRLVVKSPTPYYCTDTARQNIHVHPFIKASFTVDTVNKCSPFIINIFNNSQGPISSYLWDFGDGTTTLSTNVPQFTHQYTNLTTAPMVRKLKLTVQNSGGCIDTLSRYITVYPQVVASLSVPAAIGCNEFEVNFTNNTGASATSFVWDFGDGSTSNLKSPSHLFVNNTSTDQVFKVKLSAFSPDYCTGYDSIDITVHASLDPQFAIDVPRTCAPYNATITNKSLGGITSYLWDFGDGTPRGTSGASSFTHLYHNNTITEVTYTVKLIVENSGGCKDSVSQNISLYPEVRANFKPTLLSYCSPRRVDFENTSQLPATKFIWKFGDNATSLARDTFHIYTNNTMHDTIYYAYLIAISDDNCKDSLKSQAILVYPYIEPYFSVDTTTGCNPLTVKISNGSLGPYVEDYWNFGSTNVGAQPKVFSHVFENTGNSNKNFNIKLQISYKGICQRSYNKQVWVYSPILPKVSANMTTVCNNSEITFKDSTNRVVPPYNYKWDFGDGASSIGVYGPNRSLAVLTNHQYENFLPIYKTLQAHFSSYSQYGCQGDTTITIVVFPEVKSSFSFDDAAGCSPFIVPLKEGSTSTSTWKRFWDDEKTPSIGFPYTYLPPSITYQNDTSTTNKIFKPKLKVAYLYNGSPVCPDSITRTITVYPKVTAYFAAKDSFKICQPDTVNFANGSRIGNYRLLLNDNRLTYKWTYGDNGTSSDFEPRHIYYNYDFYRSLVDTVWLKVVSQVGNCRDSLRKIVTIYPKPDANFDVENSLACPPFKVQIDHVSKAEGGSMYNWSFNGIGNDTVTRVPVEMLYHVFTNSGSTTLSHPINLLVTTPHNCTDTASQRIYVWPPVIADFDKDTSGCHPFNVTFINKSKQSDFWYWDFGDQVISKAQSPQHTFKNFSLNDTTYTVFLKAISKEGCYNDTTQKVTVYPQPVANFEADRYYFTFSPSANVVTFTNLSNDGYWNYLWDYDDLLPKDSIKGTTQHEFLLGAPHWGGQFNVKLNVWSNNCRDSISHRITIVAPKPIADFSISENGCVPLELSFAELTSYGTGWLWEFGDGGTYNGQNPPPYTYTRAGKFNIKLTVTGDGGVSYAFKNVEVYPKPKVDFDLKPNLVMLTEKLEAKVKFYNKCSLGERFEWNFGDSTKSIELEPSHIYKAIGLYTVKLGAWTVHQCYDEIIKKDTVNVLERHEILFPNAFTPNSGGQNDGKYSTPDTKNEVFHPSWTGIVEYHLEIYDRWGEKLFESDDVNVGWNGYYKGKLCKTDVYIWKAKGKYTDGGTFEKAGNVTLLR